MKINGICATLSHSESGHLFVKIGEWSKRRHQPLPSALQDTQTACVVNIGEVTPVQIRKLHCQLGHAGVDTMVRLFRQTGYEKYDDDIKKCVVDCGYSIDRVEVQRPIVKSHVPSKCGEIVGMDVMYPIYGTGHSRPFLIMVDRLGRFAVIRRMNNHRPEHVIDLVYKMRIQQLGRPAKLLADRGSAFVGMVRKEMCDLMEMQMVLVSRESVLSRTVWPNALSA